MRIGTIAIVVAATAAGTAEARPLPQSWGRAGVSLEQYRADAIACGRFGANADIANDPATRQVIAAQDFAERNTNVEPLAAETGPIGDGLRVMAEEQARMARRLRPEKQLAEVQGTMVQTTEGCLTKLGYRRFTLTRDQARALGRLRLGTPARHAYLHALASDPAVLDRQATPAT